MTVLVCGSRDWDDAAVVEFYLAYCGIGAGDLVVHGDCRGADRLGARAAVRLGAHTRAFPADWDRDGRAAGPMRNALMLRTHPETAIVFAFHADLDASTGTRDMIRRAQGHAIPVLLIRGLGDLEAV